MNVRAGHVIADKYVLEHQLGAGGMGAVWQAHHKVLNAKVAIKLLDAALAESAVVQQRFMREGRAAAALRSAHVVQVLDFGVDEDMPFLVLELLEGESLDKHLKRVGKLGPKLTHSIITQICRAVGRAHDANIVHRDLKPANVFLVDEDDLLVKVLDFGIAKMRDPESAAAATHTGATLGTLLYMSPEQARASRDVDGRADLWSLAIIAFECLLGERPFKTTSLHQLVMEICEGTPPRPSSIGEVPAGFDAWFRRGTQHDPTKRFQSARELAESLGAALGLSEADASPGSPQVVGAVTPAEGLDSEPTRVPVSDTLTPAELAAFAPTALSDDDPSLPAATTGGIAAAEVDTSTDPKPKGPWRWMGGAAAVALLLGALALAFRGAREAPEQPSAPPDTLETAASTSAASASAAPEVTVAEEDPLGAPSASVSAVEPDAATKPAPKPPAASPRPQPKPTPKPPPDDDFDPLERR